MKKVLKIFIFAIIYLATFQLKAQYVPHDSIGIPFNYEMYLATIAQKSPPLPTIEAVAVVTTVENGATVYLRFSEPSAGIQYTVSEQDQQEITNFTDITNFTTEKGSIVLTGLALEKEYSVSTLDASNKRNSIVSFSTKTGRKVQGIEVSNALYGLITRYQKLQQPIPFPEYLEQSVHIHPIEKTAFLQDYYFDGKPLDNWDGNTYIGKEIPPRGGNDDCMCSFILNRYKSLTPSSNGTGLSPNGIISPYVQEDGEDNLPGATMGETSWWTVKSSKGAARYHQLWTQGYRAGGANQSYLIDDTNNGNPGFTSAANTSLLRYNLFCQNLAYVPKECECEKPLRLYFGYDAEVQTVAKKVKGGVGGRNAFAAGHDLSAAVFHVDGSTNYSVMKTMDVRHDSECERKVDPNFWANWAVVAAKTVGVIYSLSDSNFTNVDSMIFQLSINNLRNDLVTALGTNYWESNGCDDNGQVTGFMAGDTLVYLKPNEPVSMYIFAYGKLQTGGKRAWHSTARILSDFYLAGYIPGGPLDDQSLLCCSPKIADWMLASHPDAPKNEASLRTIVAGKFSAFAPWNTASTANALRNWGHEDILVHPDCRMETVEPSDPLNGPGVIERSLSNTNVNLPIGQFYLFDQMGRMVWKGAPELTPEQARLLLRENRLGLGSGVYILHWYGNATTKPEKIFIH